MLGTYFVEKQRPLIYCETFIVILRYTALKNVRCRTFNHAMMSDKLGAIGCDDGSVKWFNSYLSNISQFIDIKGTLSDRGEVTCGVPQGSILGPLLF